MDLSILSKAKEKTQELRKNVALDNYEEGARLFDEFIETRDFDILKTASKIFSNTIEYNKEDPRPYISLGYIFYLLENNEFALKYFDLAEKLIGLPEEIKEIKTNIEEEISYLRNTVQEKPHLSLIDSIKAMKPVDTKVVVNEKSSFWKIFSKK
jgi:tetratricopeptide (TPR) repeat protein